MNGFEGERKELSPNTLAGGAWRHLNGGAKEAVSCASPEPRGDGMPLGLAKSQLPFSLLGKAFPSHMPLLSGELSRTKVSPDHRADHVWTPGLN